MDHPVVVLPCHIVNITIKTNTVFTFIQNNLNYLGFWCCKMEANLFYGLGLALGDSSIVSHNTFESLSSW